MCRRSLPATALMLAPQRMQTPAGQGMGASGTLAYADHPTFTFTPMTGDYFARAYIHPFAPAVILPLANSGVPVDLLLRIGVMELGGCRTPPC